ncbi:beta-ketoacyl-ACP synthase II [Pseudohongiella spirulinae]|uniref:3-oxoacyl-[acyl-carrier-protein] synthase 2 n=1 Tax=Pseudohongiella spirulinae TaxID=1249552 RepID=A0A0S2KCX0_9GAMM|nr:beta-ketoacyl-ACP synthase II [Pseudohongiella spirulinae]ALO46167.1 3-oxoacyl-ACP synthase [Pseudohongiella spirulinae]
MNGRRVVVTGLGMVTPLGNDVASTWDGLKSGRSGINPIEHFDVSAFSTRFGGSIKALDYEPYLAAKDAKRMDVFLIYGMVAGIQAMRDAGFDSETASSFDPLRFGAAIGSGIGGITAIEDTAQLIRTSGPRKVSPFFVPGSIINMIGGSLSIRYNLQGPNIALTTACTTGTHNIGFAAQMIASGQADLMMAGGAEMATSPVGLGGFCAARALSTRNDDPQAASRPWDKDRDGFVLSDGAGVMVLEEYEHAVKRGATIYAELLGFGMSADAFHMTSPSENGRGAANCMQNALNSAGLNPDQIDYINAHGTSTLAGDLAETQAIKTVFGDHANKLAVSSSKSMIGHLLGAAGAVEAIISVLSLHHQLITPTINLESPDEGCDLDYVPKNSRDAALRAVLSNSFGFGGTNGSLIFSQPNR